MFDVAVIGGGPGGYFAAIRAKQLGAKVVLIEKAKIGGVCLNRGCIPTKTLLNSAQKWEQIRDCADYGIVAGKLQLDYKKVFLRKEQVVSQLRTGMAQVLKSYDIEYIEGQAVLQPAGKIEVLAGEDRKIIQSGKIIIASGSEPFAFSFPGSELPGVINSDELLSQEEIPPSMLVIGAGAVGVEFAAIYRSFGCEVTLVEMFPSILPNMDSDIIKRMAVLLKKKGIKILTNTKVNSIKKSATGLEVIAETNGENRSIDVKSVLVAAGRRPVVEGMGLKESGIAYSSKGIIVNEKMETNVPGIYAIGDATGQYMWAHVASAEGIIAAENAMGKQLTMNYSAVPGCIFTTPEIACVGLTEEQARAMGKTIAVNKSNFASNGKAVSMSETDGFVKVIAEAGTNLTLGMHILGPHASDLIMEGTIAIQNGLTTEMIAQTIHPHPTLSETVAEAFNGVTGDNINQLKMKVRR